MFPYLYVCFSRSFLLSPLSLQPNTHSPRNLRLALFLPLAHPHPPPQSPQPLSVYHLFVPPSASKSAFFFLVLASSTSLPRPPSRGPPRTHPFPSPSPRGPPWSTASPEASSYKTRRWCCKASGATPPASTPAEQLTWRARERASPWN